MNTVFKSILFSFFLIFGSCNNSKGAIVDTDSDVVAQKEVMQQKYVEEGYLAGRVKYLKDSECPFIIIDERTNAKFDPINFDDDKFVLYKTDQLKIYFKYRPLRRMNRCNEASPIELENIKKRED